MKRYGWKQWQKMFHRAVITKRKQQTRYLEGRESSPVFLRVRPQSNNKNGSFSCLTLSLNIAAVQIDRSPGQRQPESISVKKA